MCSHAHGRVAFSRSGARACTPAAGKQRWEPSPLVSARRGQGILRGNLRGAHLGGYEVRQVPRGAEAPRVEALLPRLLDPQGGRAGISERWMRLLGARSHRAAARGCGGAPGHACERARCAASSSLPPRHAPIAGHDCVAFEPGILGPRAGAGARGRAWQMRGMAAGRSPGRAAHGDNGELPVAPQDLIKDCVASAKDSGYTPRVTSLSVQRPGAATTTPGPRAGPWGDRRRDASRLSTLPHVMCSQRRANASFLAAARRRLPGRHRRGALLQEAR